MATFDEEGEIGDITDVTIDNPDYAAEVGACEPYQAAVATYHGAVSIYNDALGTYNRAITSYNIEKKAYDDGLAAANSVLNSVIYKTAKAAYDACPDNPLAPAFVCIDLFGEIPTVPPVPPLPTLPTVEKQTV